MLADHERAAFEEIAAHLGPLSEPTPPYLMPWWMPPGVLGFYGLLMVVAGVMYTVEGLLVFGAVVFAVAVHWTLHRRRRRPDGGAEMSYLRPFIN